MNQENDDDPFRNIGTEYLEILQTLAERANYSNRSSKNRAIVDYVLELHSIWRAYMRDHHDLARKSGPIRAMSMSVSTLLEPSLHWLAKAIFSERDPHFIYTDDGDELGDEFTSMALVLYEQLKVQLSVGADAEIVVGRCIEDIRAALISEFARQASNSWAV